MPNDLWERAKGATKASGRVALGVLRVVAQASSQYMESPAPCAGCRQEFPRKTMSSLTDIPTYADRWYVHFCADCRERLRAAYLYQGTLHAENRKVLAQLKRATDKRLPATLTLDQWVTTLDHYRWCCAYCLVAPYEAMEHVVPIERGGGTTADNCVPACKACNAAKGVRHPDDIRESSRSPAAMARVRDYLKTRQPSIPTTKAISEVDESPEQEASNDA